jgi:hypothetical protein
MASEFVKFHTADGFDLIRKSNGQVFGVTCTGLEGRAASLYRIGDYLLVDAEGDLPTPRKITLSRIVAMEFVAPANDALANEPEPAHA